MRDLRGLKALVKQKFEKHTCRSQSPALCAESSQAKMEDNPISRLDASIQHAQEAISQLQPPQLFAHDLVPVVGDANSTVDETITLANTWDLLLINIRIFSNLVDKVVEV